MKFKHLLLFLLLPSALFGNNIQVSNLALVSENRLESFVYVQFDISWENSWRISSGSGNRDAAWIFVKYRVGNGEWKHARLHNTEYVAGSGTPSEISVGLMNDGTTYNMDTNPVTGAFLYRSAESYGNFTNTGMRLRWNYGADGIASGVNVDVRVFAIEMVYVPQGAFNVGGGGGTNAFTSTTINTANATTAPSGTGSLGGQAGGYPTGQSAPANASFPNGYNAFYCMKYEISQQQYVEFLNTLTQAQADARKANETANRYGITGSSPGNYTTSMPYVACNFFSWADGAAYADWACLRPMTELEYEKACRGNQPPVVGEYAWGTAQIATTPYALSNSGQINEQIAENYSTSAGNANYSSTDGSIDGPFRVGIFAANSGNLNRITSGSSYWGVLELSGNLMERCISAGHPVGLLFTGKNGNGSITSNGEADVENWPSANAAGAGFRGGSWYIDASELRVSDRDNGNDVAEIRFNWCGFRCVRSF